MITGEVDAEGLPIITVISPVPVLVPVRRLPRPTPMSF